MDRRVGVCGRCEIGGVVEVEGARGCELSVWPRSFPFGALRFGLDAVVAPTTPLCFTRIGQLRFGRNAVRVMAVASQLADWSPRRRLGSAMGRAGRGRDYGLVTPLADQVG